jgi:hypothetical protein
VVTPRARLQQVAGHLNRPFVERHPEGTEAAQGEGRIFLRRGGGNESRAMKHTPAGRPYRLSITMIAVTSRLMIVGW